MVVQEAKLMWSRTASDFSTTDTRDRKLVIKESYSVVCDADDTLLDVYGADGLPDINDIYEGTVNCRVKSVDVQKVSLIFYYFNYTYEGATGPAGLEDSPINDPPSIQWSKISTEEAIDEALKDGGGTEPIVTANGEPMEGVTMALSDLVLTVKRNYLSIDLPATYAYLHSVNSDVFAGFEPGVGRLTDFSATSVVAEELPSGAYWEVSAQITFRYPWRTTPEKSWYARVRHEGYYEKIDGIIKRAVDDNKEPVTKPVLLKEDGTRETDPDNAFWKEWKRYTPLSYNALGLLD